MDRYDNWGDPPADNENSNEQTGKKGKGMNTENIISFRKKYTEAEKIVLHTKVERIRKWLDKHEAGYCRFTLGNGFTAAYQPNGNEQLRQSKISFYSESDKSPDWYFARSLFIAAWEDYLKKEIKKAKNTEREYEALEKAVVLPIAYTREDGIDTILMAHEANPQINIKEYLELKDLTEQEITDFVEHGYGFNCYKKVSDSVDHAIGRKLNIGYHDYNCAEKVQEWTRENPERCLAMFADGQEK